MIDIDNVKKQFEIFINQFDNKSKLGFELKVMHTNYVVKNAEYISRKLNLSDEDINLAKAIAYFHDMGRFEELFKYNCFDSTEYDHAKIGIDFLFNSNFIRKFIEDTKYDEIIKESIYNHNKISIQNGLDERTLLHCKIIRDADKLDNFRVKEVEKIEVIFPNILSKKEEIENSKISDKVYETIKKEKCVDILDRNTPIDYWICVLAFVFDINFKETMEIIKEKDYINKLIDRFVYNDIETRNRIKDIRQILNNYIANRVK